MKKTVIITLSIIIALCLALAGASALLKNEPESPTTTTTGAPTSTTSGTITTSSTASTTTSTTATTTNGEYIQTTTLETLMGSIDFNKGIYLFTSVDHTLSSIVKNMSDIGDFLDSFINNKNQQISNDPSVVSLILSEANDYARNSSQYYEKIVFSVSFYHGNSAPCLSVHVYPNGTAYITSIYGTFVTVNTGAVDWQGIMKEYFYYEVEL